MLYKHEPSEYVMRSPVVGGADFPGSTLKELVLLPGEHVSSVQVHDGRLCAITTSFERELRCGHGASVNRVWSFEPTEFRGLSAKGMNPHWTIIPRFVNSSPRSTPLPEAARARLEELNSLREQIKKHPQQQQHQPRVNETERSCFEILRRLYAAHGSITAVEARQLVPIYEATNSFREALETFSYNINKLTRLWGSKPSLDHVEDLVKLEKLVIKLVNQELTQGFASGLNARNEQAVRGIIQAQIDASAFNMAAKLCSAAAGVFNVNDLILQLVFEAFQVRDQSYFDQARSLAEAFVQLPGLMRGYSALHAAVAKHFFHLAQLLVQRVGMNPLACDNDKRVRPIDLLGELTSAEASDREVQQIVAFLDKSTKEHEFQQRLTAILRSTVVTHKALKELIPHITTVYNLQVLVTLGRSHLEHHENKQLLDQACEHVISNKLVLDDTAAVYFKLGLKGLYAKGYFTAFELETWCIRTDKVNMESAPWVAEMQHVIAKMQTKVVMLNANVHVLKNHFEKLHQALLDKTYDDQKRAKRERIIAFVALTLGWACGPLIKELVSSAMDLADPATVLSVMLGPDQVTDYITSNCAPATFSEGINTMLKYCDISSMDFAAALKEAVVLQEAEHAAAPAARNYSHSFVQPGGHHQHYTQGLKHSATAPAASFNHHTEATAHRDRLSALSQSMVISSSSGLNDLTFHDRAAQKYFSGTSPPASSVDLLKQQRGRCSSVQHSNLPSFVHDPEYRVFQIRFWCEAQRDGNDTDHFGNLRGFQFIYRHERAGQIMTGPVTGETLDAAEPTELLLFPGEHVASFTCSSGILAIGTNFHRGLRCSLRDEVVIGGTRAIASDSELRALHGEQDIHAHWRIAAHEAVRFTRVPQSSAAIARFTVIDNACNALRGAIEGVESEPWVQKWFSGPLVHRVDARLFTLHGLLSTVEAQRHAAPTRAAVTEIYKIVELLTLTVNGLKCPTVLRLAKSKLIESCESRLAQVEGQVKTLALDVFNANERGNIDGGEWIAGITKVLMTMQSTRQTSSGTAHSNQGDNTTVDPLQSVRHTAAGSGYSNQVKKSSTTPLQHATLPRKRMVCEPRCQQSPPEEEAQQRGLTAHDFESQRLDGFLYHYVVQQSYGDLVEFLHLLEVVDGDVNEAHEVIVKEDLTGEYKRLALPPYVFASYLGYEEIVTHFRNRQDFKSWKGGESMVVTINRVRKVARAAQGA